MRDPGVIRLSGEQARRLAVAAQGLDRPRPSGRVDRRHLRGVIRRLGLLQIDSVNVVVPAHYQVPFSRLGSYDRAALDRLVHVDREFTEHWAHEASILPVDHWPLLMHRMNGDDAKTNRLGRILTRRRAYAERVLAEVRERGPVAASEIAEPDGSRASTSGWWGWTWAKAVLEALFARGELAIAGRRAAGFARLYDLAERVVPAEHRLPVPREEAHRRLLEHACRALGVGTARDLADYYRLPIKDARARLTEMVEEGTILPARVEDWKEPAFLHREARLPRHARGATLLSPFDPLIWFRPRVERLFDFRYRIEIYVPRAKRRFGYYVLPFLLGDRLVARVDLKADRAGGALLVPAAHAEPGVEHGEVAEALAVELREWASWLGLGSVTVGRGGDLSGALAARFARARGKRAAKLRA